MAEMGVAPELQLYQLVSAFLLGVLLEMIWEAMDCIDSAGSAFLTGIVEILFLTAGLFAMFLLGQSIGGGQLRLFMLAAVLCGFCTAKALFGRKLRAGYKVIGGWIYKGIGILLMPIKQMLILLKKVKKIFKILYANAKNWFTITEIQQEGTDTKPPFLYKGKRSGASNQVSDCDCFDRADCIQRGSPDTGCAAASSSGANADSAAGYRANAESSYPGITIRYE